MIRKKIVFNTIISTALILFCALCQAKIVKMPNIFQQVGIATFYHDKYHGRPTASGEIYNKNKLTAQHNGFPFGTLLRVTNLQNHRTVNVVVNDRAPHDYRHILDLSKQAAKKLGFIRAGRTKVKIEAIHLGSA